MKPKKKPLFRVSLKSERKRIGLTQDKTSTALAIPKRTYCDWEYGVSTPREITQEGALARLAALNSKPPTP